MEIIALQPDAAVLDAASGTGALKHEFVAALPVRGEITGATRKQSDSRVYVVPQEAYHFACRWNRFLQAPQLRIRVIVTAPQPAAR